MCLEKINNWTYLPRGHAEHRIGVTGDLALVPVKRQGKLVQILEDVGIVGPLYVHSNHWHVREFKTRE